jgi:phosphoglycerate dehydrogenase-like enzyme
MVEVVVLNQDAAHYADAIRTRLPEVVVHGVTNATAAHACCGNADVLVALGYEVSDPLLAAMPALRWIQTLTTGVDKLLALGNLAADVRVSTGRGIHGPQMAELAFLYMIALSRDFRAMMANQANAHWQRGPQTLLLGKTAVLVGVGSISEAIASRCQAFGMRVIGVSDSRHDAPGFDTILPRSDLVRIAAQADFLIVLVPLDATTTRLIDRQVIGAMQPHGFLINLARGPVLDEAALIEALESHRIAGAGLDVFEVEPLPPESPLWRMSNVILTPHIGGMSNVYTQQFTPLLLDNLVAYTQGRMADMRNVVRG